MPSVRRGQDLVCVCGACGGQWASGQRVLGPAPPRPCRPGLAGPCTCDQPLYPLHTCSPVPPLSGTFFQMPSLGSPQTWRGLPTVSLAVHLLAGPSPQPPPSWLLLSDPVPFLSSPGGRRPPSGHRVCLGSAAPSNLSPEHGISHCQGFPLDLPPIRPLNPLIRTRCSFPPWEEGILEAGGAELGGELL